MLVGQTLRSQIETSTVHGTRQGLNGQNPALIKANRQRQANKALDSWYKWIEAHAKSPSIHQAVTDSVLRETMGRSVNRRWEKQKRTLLRSVDSCRPNRQQNIQRVNCYHYCTFTTGALSSILTVIKIYFAHT